MKRSIITLVLALGTAAAASSPAWAQIRHLTTSAALCNPAKGDVGKVGYTSAGAVQNDSTSSSAKVFCAAPTLSTYTLARADVVVRDRSSSGNISCTLNVTDFQTGGIVFTDTKTSTGSSSTGQGLTLSNFGGTGPTSFSCTLPANSGSASSVVGFIALSNL